MSFQVSRTVWFHNGYGVEFVIVNPYEISFNVILEKDPIMVSTSNACIGSDASHRNAEVEEESGEVIPGSEETMRDFAIRAYGEGISYAEEMITEHKETNDLGTIFGEVLDAQVKVEPLTKQ